MTSRTRVAGGAVTLVLTVAIVTGTVGVVSGVSGASTTLTSGPETAVSLVGSDVTAAPGERRNLKVVVDGVDGGVGAIDIAVEAKNTSVAHIVDAEVARSLDPAVADVSDPDDRGDVDIRAAGTDTADTGSVTVAVVTVEALRQGVTELALRVQTVGTEQAQAYTITASNDATITVGGGSESGTDSDGNDPPTVTGEIDGTERLDGVYYPGAELVVSGVDPDGDVTSINYTVDGGPEQRVERSNVRIPLPEIGNHSVQYRAVDDDGATSPWRETRVKIDPGEGPIESFSVTDPGTAVEVTLVTDEPLVGLETTLSANGREITDRVLSQFVSETDLAAETYEYRATFRRVDAGETYRIDLEEASTPETTYNWADGRNATVTVAREDVQLQVEADDTRVVEGETVGFLVTRASDGFSIWNATLAVDGQTRSTGATDSYAEYTFESPGTYTVTVSKQGEETDYRSANTTVEVVGATDDTELAGTWATFQGSNRRLGTPERSAAVVSQPTRAWRRFTPGYRSAPVVAGGVVYELTVDDLRALDASNGETLWRTTLATDADFRTAPVVVDDWRADRQTVYAADTSGQLHAVDAETGRLRWRTQLAAPGASSGTVTEQFAVANDVAYVPVDDPTTDDAANPDGLVAVNLNTRTVLWTNQSDHVGGVAIGEDEDKLYASAGEDRMLMKFVADRNGANYWSYKVPTSGGLARGDRVIGAPTVWNDETVYIKDETYRIHAVDEGSGTADWVSDPLPRDDVNLPDHPTSLAATDRRLFVSNDEDALFALDRATGAKEWTFSPSSAPSFLSPAVIDGTVYATTEAGALYAVDAAAGTELWHRDGTSGAPEQAPAVADDTVVYNSGLYLETVTDEPTTGVVEGTVTDSFGRPVSNASVGLYPPRFSNRYGSVGTNVTMTDADGRFRLRVPAIGASDAYRFEVSAPGFRNVTRGVTVASGGPQRLNATLFETFRPEAVGVSPSSQRVAAGDNATVTVSVVDVTGGSNVSLSDVPVTAAVDDPDVRLAGPAAKETGRDGTVSYTLVTAAPTAATLNVTVPTAGLTADATVTVESRATSTLRVDAAGLTDKQGRILTVPIVLADADSGIAALQSVNVSVADTSVATVAARPLDASSSDFKPENLTVRDAGPGHVRLSVAALSNRSVPAGETVTVGAVRLYARTPGTTTVSATSGPGFDARLLSGSPIQRRQSYIEVETQSGSVAVDPAPLPTGIPGTTTAPPTDPDGDDLYEDLDGDGNVTYNDVVVLFETLDRSLLQTEASAFDYNGNGRLDYVDVVDLFRAATG
jgi:outer membrane protein assembly factor BamB